MCSPFEPGAPSAYSSTDPVLAVSCQVLIKRFCFRNSIEEAVVELHAKIKDGSVKLTDGPHHVSPPAHLRLPPEPLFGRKA